jgi:hypothetical protein
MRIRIMVIGALIAALSLATAGAGTGSSSSGQLNLRDTAAVDAYLRSKGIDPATVVRQTSLQNYAGPNCPGIGWNCTTSPRVIQLAQPGGTNVFEFSSDNSANNDCGVPLQDAQGGQNKFHCKMRSTSDNASQDVFIEQLNAKRNLAIIDFDINSRGGPEQDAIQTAEVHQTATEKNDVHINESVKQATSISDVDGSQSQEAHQVAIVDQEVTGSENYAHVHQSQDQRESGSATDQQQNTELVLPTGVTDCDQEESTKSAPNACANISQDALDAPQGAKNKSDLHQSINQDQSTKALFADQEQGESPGGIEGEIDPSNPLDVGTSDKTAHQDHRQRQSGPNGTTQEQVIDPDCCGFSTTVGGTGNTDNFDQTAIQSSTGGADADQSLFISGNTSHVSETELLGPSVLSNGPNGTDRCTITHHAANNLDSAHGTIRQEPCEFLIVETNCENFFEYEGSSEGCSGPTEVSSSSSLSTVFQLPSTPTLGLAIEPANLGEPAGFTDPLLPLPGT